MRDLVQQQTLSEIKKESLKSRLVLTVHDSLIYEVPEVELEAIQKLVMEEVRRPVEGVLVQMDAKIKIGDRWTVA